MNRLTLRCSNHFTYRYLIKCRRIWLPKLLPVRKVSGYTKLIHFQPYPAKEKELIRWLNFLRKEKINIVWRQISPLTERILDLVTPPPQLSLLHFSMPPPPQKKSDLVARLVTSSENWFRTSLIQFDRKEADLSMPGDDFSRKSNGAFPFFSFSVIPKPKKEALRIISGGPVAWGWKRSPARLFFQDVQAQVCKPVTERVAVAVAARPPWLLATWEGLTMRD